MEAHVAEVKVSGSSEAVKRSTGKDHTGERFGRLVVIGRDAEKRTGRTIHWKCSCDCGGTCVADGAKLRSGRTRSCGCLRAETASTLHRTHGDSDSPEYRVWTQMWTRCTNPRHEHYDRYGGRGISISERWKEFPHFLSDMGRRPSAQHSIERRDPNGNYEPANCHWASKSEQARNRRTSRMITAFGETKTVAEWAEKTGVGRTTICWRIARGMSPEKALS